MSAEIFTYELRIGASKTSRIKLWRKFKNSASPKVFEDAAHIAKTN